MVKLCASRDRTGEIRAASALAGSVIGMTLGRNFNSGFFPQARTKLWLFALILGLTTSPSLARARDDVIAGMFRCAAVGDTRTWLDCYYGAAQPLRVQLGIVPAPQSQVRLAQNPPAGAPTGDLGPRYQATAAALRCNDLSEDRPWLNCYYAAAGPVRAQLGLSSAPQSAAVARTGSAEVLASAPGPARGALLPKSGSPALPSVWSPVASYHFDRYGIFTLELANGQQWQQLSGDTTRAHWTKPAADYSVRITHGALRSLNLKVRGEPVTYKVEQIE